MTMTSKYLFLLLLMKLVLKYRMSKLLGKASDTFLIISVSSGCNTNLLMVRTSVTAHSANTGLQTLSSLEWRTMEPADVRFVRMWSCLCLVSRGLDSCQKEHVVDLIIQDARNENSELEYRFKEDLANIQVGEFKDQSV